MSDSLLESLLKDLLLNQQLANAANIDAIFMHRSFSLLQVESVDDVFTVRVSDFYNCSNVAHAFYVDESGNNIECVISVESKHSLLVFLPYKPTSGFDINFIRNSHFPLDIPVSIISTNRPFNGNAACMFYIDNALSDDTISLFINDEWQNVAFEDLNVPNDLFGITNVCSGTVFLKIERNGYNTLLREINYSITQLDVVFTAVGAEFKFDGQVHTLDVTFEPNILDSGFEVSGIQGIPAMIDIGSYMSYLYGGVITYGNKENVVTSNFNITYVDNALNIT